MRIIDLFDSPIADLNSLVAKLNTLERVRRSSTRAKVEQMIIIARTRMLNKDKIMRCFVGESKKL